MSGTNGKAPTQLEQDGWTKSMRKGGEDYMVADVPGWTPLQIAHARNKVKIGKRKSRGGSEKDIEKNVLMNLVLSIEECDCYNWSIKGKTRKEVETQCDIVVEGLQRAESLQREWRLVDRLPKGFYDMKKVWHHMKQLGALNRAQSAAILLVLRGIKKDLHVRLGEMNVEEDKKEQEQALVLARQEQALAHARARARSSTGGQDRAK